MIIIRLNGGLGNQMFQYACGRNQAFKYETELLFDTSLLGLVTTGSSLTKRSYALDVFGIQNNSIDKISQRGKFFLHRILNMLSIKLRGRGIQTKNFFVENAFAYNPFIENTTNDCFLAGYWQSPLYFQNMESLIRNDFQFKPKLNEVNAKWIREIKSVNAVSLHIRRADFINNKSHSIHGTCSIEYYMHAVNHVASKTNAPVFFIFSDDAEWAKNNLKLPYTCHFISGNEGDKSYIDMQLMSNCNHNIIANSSFSWWGAWLNENPDKLVIAPKQWFLDAELNKQTDDLIPQKWVRI
jgi:hypothetical protein